MTEADVLEKIKNAMRIRHNALDSILTDDIRAGALDMTRAGVSVYQSKGDELLFMNDELIATAIRFYAMAVEDYEGKGQLFMSNYKNLRDSLSLHKKYKMDGACDEE